MTSHPSGPLQPIPLDGPAQRRRRLATGAGIVAVAGIVVAGMSLANRPGRQPVSPQAALGAPSSSPSSTAAVTPSATPSPGTAAASATAEPTSVPASATASATTSRADVD